MTKAIPQCHHIKTSGSRCGSPALKGRQFCFNHNQAHTPGINPKNAEAFIPLLESGESIQLATTNILRALAADYISEKKAYAMFFGIQQLGIAFRHLEKPDYYYIETNIEPGMQRVLDQDNSDTDSLARNQRIHAKGFDADYGTLENPLPLSAITNPDDIEGCWVDIPVAPKRSKSPATNAANPADGSRSPSSDAIRETAESKDVILTAHEVSRKDLFSAAATPSAPGNSHQQPSELRDEGRQQDVILSGVEKRESANHHVILSDGEAAAKGLCTSADDDPPLPPKRPPSSLTTDDLQYLCKVMHAKSDPDTLRTALKQIAVNDPDTYQKFLTLLERRVV